MNFTKVTATLISFLVTAPISVQANEYPFNSKASEALYPLYAKYGGNKTLYCGCTLIDENKSDVRGCGLASPTKAWMKVDGIEWTSIISPKEIIDGMANNACWSSEPCMDFTTNEYTMGHNCCIKSNKEYQTIFSDLNVIAPVASSVAKYRNLRTAGQPKSTFTFGACHFSVDGEHYKQTLRSLGIEARTRLFLNKIYGIQFSKPVLEKAKMDAELYPPTYYEKSLSRAIRDIQGVGNPFTIDDWKKKKPTPYRNQEAVNLLDKIGELADINATNQK